MKKIWLFSSYNWQGNPKALFLYMNSQLRQTHECWWLADTLSDSESLKKLGIQNILYVHQKKYNTLVEKCDVYVTENFREKYPHNLSKKAKIFNTWHGVGLKHIELGLDAKSVLADSIVRKYVRNYSIYKNQTYFLATSYAMEKHFIEDTIINESQIIRGPYPRNIVYKTIQSYDANKIFNKKDFNNIILFAPTYRVNRIDGVLQSLIPDFNKLSKTIESQNDLFIVKVHPFMKEDSYFIEMQKKYEESSNILFWDDRYDIYEIFHSIDIAIIDYSSIFYDLLEANVSKFIRYIPDFKEYTKSLELIGDYTELTIGTICESFENLLHTLKHDLTVAKNKEQLLNYFFSYSSKKTLDQLIHEVDAIKVKYDSHKQLHSFDIFDTLIRRSTLAPYSIFAFMQKKITGSEINLPDVFKENWIQIRHQVEIDVRDIFRKTTFERKTDKIEINFDLIYERLKENYLLSNEQIEFLKTIEIQAEIDHVEPIQSRINYLVEQQKLGHDVILISDMYLPESVIRTMLSKADSRLSKLPLYLSSSIGHQKSTGKLYKHIFFEKKYEYEKWVHYGDNAHADGSMPRKLGIETRIHQMDSFIPFENKLIEKSSNSFKYEAYQLATHMQRYRQKLLQDNPKISNQEIEKRYYAYAYAGSLLVPYVHWTILNALERGYETLYFISRDGHYLKLIADQLIKQNNYPIQSKFIYGSRKVWRLPSYIHEIDKEMFGPFGNFVELDSFDDLVRASYLTEAELLHLHPEFEALKSSRHFRGEIAENIRSTLERSKKYRNKILGLASEQRTLVRQYLQENINFSEKFAFVEFWGRGYTQDTFARLLEDAAGYEIKNPFYYIRSFKLEDSINLRHNFVLAPTNFSFFEPLFATTPYLSISAYEKANNKIQPVIHPNINEYYEYFEKGLVEFAQDYSKVDINCSINFARLVNEHSYTYQLNNANDQFMCNVFACLKDNISSYGVPKEYAPILVLEDLETIRDKKDLDQLTSSIAISLARSSDEVRKYYQQIFKKMKLPSVPNKAIQNMYPANDLNHYIRAEKFPMKVVSTQKNSIFLDINLSNDSKLQNIQLEQCEIFEVTGIEWLKNGLPRLVTPHGYVTANKDWVLPLAEAEGIYVQKNSSGEYEAIQQPQLHNNKLVVKLISLIEQPYKMLRKDADLEHIERKWNKFTRDPYQFFADAKNPKLIHAKIIFDENQIIGKKISHWIRKNL